MRSRLSLLTATFLALLPTVSSGCFRASIKPERPTVVIRPCGLREPPELMDVEIMGPDAGCPHELCLDIPNAVALAYDLQVLMDYAVEAHTLCGGGVTFDGGVQTF
jgi:hypothetical protein